MSSFITVSEERQKKWLQYDPLPPSIISILDKNMNVIPNKS
jgi:hypothetical protein